MSAGTSPRSVNHPRSLITHLSDSQGCGPVASQHARLHSLQRLSPRQTMPAPDMVDTARVSMGDSNNNNVRAPSAMGFFHRALGRVSSALNPRQDNAGEDQIERGEHNPQDEGPITPNEENSSPEPAAIIDPLAEAATVQQEQHSPFSSRAFDRLPQPVPVEDVFFGSWWLVLALRTATRPGVIYFSTFWMWPTSIVVSSLEIMAVITAILLLRWLLLKAGRNTIPLIGGPIPGKRQLLWALSRWIQKYWVCSPGRIHPLRSPNTP